MKCNTNKLFAYIDGTLKDEDIIKIEEHLENCEVCRETVDTFKLMETVGEQNYHVDIDVVDRVRSLTDDELYSNKKLLFMNKFLPKKKSFIKYASVATIAIVMATGALNASKFIFGEHIKGSNVAPASPTPQVVEENKDYNKNYELREKNIEDLELSDMERERLEEHPLGAKVKNNFKYPDKEELHFKLYNAVDNFKTAKGEFIDEWPNLTASMKGSFIVDVENKASVSVDETEGKKPITEIYHNDKRKTYDDNNKIYREFDEVQHKGKNMIVRPIRIFLQPALTRSDTGYLGVSKFIISNEAIPTYLAAYEDWDYTESTFLGRAVYKLEGVIDRSMTERSYGKFSLIMDKETGIMLKFLSFDDKGNIKHKVECTKLELNTPIDEGVYNKDTSGYVKK